MKGSNLLFGCALFAACGSQHDRLDAEVGALRAEVAEMRARERERAETVELMENRILILEGGEGGHGEAPVAAAEPPSGERGLPVVALAPEAEAPEEEPVEGDLPEIHAPGAAGRATPARRPSFVLEGGGRRSPPVAAPPAPTPGGHDSLGVVPLAESPTAPPSAYDEGVSLARARRFAEAAVALKRFLAENAGHANAPAAQFLLAECASSQGRHLDAIGELERLMRRYPGHRTADALLQTGVAYAALGDRDRARELFQAVVTRHPGTSAAARASERVAQIDSRRPGGRP